MTRLTARAKDARQHKSILEEALIGEHTKAYGNSSQVTLRKKRISLFASTMQIRKRETPGDHVPARVQIK